MCFLKHIISQRTIDFAYLQTKQSLDKQPFNQEPVQIYEGDKSVKESQLILNCLQMLSFSSNLMSNLADKLNQSEQILKQSSKLLQMTQKKQQQNAYKLIKIQTNDGGFMYPKSSQFIEQNDKVNPGLVFQLFKKKNYLYKLSLSCAFPSILYKQRNFGLKINLLNNQNTKIRNGNLICCCAAFCDNYGNWIQQTKQGITFIKGKIQTELLHGEGEFMKLAPRDVSRGYADRQLNLVIYTKPSLLKYHGECSLEKTIDPDLIEPLIIKNISIKAKKRQ